MGKKSAQGQQEQIQEVQRTCLLCIVHLLMCVARANGQHQKNRKINYWDVPKLNESTKTLLQAATTKAKKGICVSPGSCVAANSLSNTFQVTSDSCAAASVFSFGAALK